MKKGIGKMKVYSTGCKRVHFAVFYSGAGRREKHQDRAPEEVLGNGILARMNANGRLAASET